MTFNELNKIEKILKEKLDSQTRAKTHFKKIMREKYDEYGGYRNNMNDAERKTYETLCKDYDDSYEAYKAFMEHQW